MFSKSANLARVQTYSSALKFSRRSKDQSSPKWQSKNHNRVGLPFYPNQVGQAPNGDERCVEALQAITLAPPFFDAFKAPYVQNVYDAVSRLMNSRNTTKRSASL